MSEAILKRMQDASAAREAQADNRIAQFLRRPVAPRAVRGDVGLELEIEANGLPPFVDYVTPETCIAWGQHRDGSLRGECTEYVVEGPVNIEEVDGALDGLFDAFKNSKTKLLLSNRCSTHVHLNFSYMTPRPITSFVALWTIVEEAVTNWCGHHRVSNPFAMRAVDSAATLELWEAILDGQPLVKFGADQRDREHRYKYNALNLLPLWQYGSIEVRSLRGAEKRKMVKVWVKFLWALREEARTTYQNPMTIAQQVSANDALGLIEGIIERHDLGDFWREVVEHPDNGELRAMMRRGFLLIQPMLFGPKWELGKDGEEAARLPEDGQARREREQRQRDRQMMIERREAIEREQAAAQERQRARDAEFERIVAQQREAGMGFDPLPVEHVMRDPLAAMEELRPIRPKRRRGAVAIDIEAQAAPVWAAAPEPLQEDAEIAHDLNMLDEEPQPADDFDLGAFEEGE